MIGRTIDFRGFVHAVRLERDAISDFASYPFSIPAVRGLDTLELSASVTFLIGENGSGKSTLIEAIAVAAGFNAEGGTRNIRFATRSTESDLHRHLRLVRTARRLDGFFLRAESLFNVATQIDALSYSHAYGGTSLHEQSHGESFLAVVKHRFSGNGLYLLDEPEAALSPQRQLALLSHIHELAERRRSQFLIATHSPILMAYPGALLYQLDAAGIAPVRYQDTEHYRITRDFLADPERYFKHLFFDRE
ncbi:MAG TPA: AAA family ATPase [Kofleriaceae bacterium]|jgi:predicted ATPase|nr:AAA family ATPase [Kofleriaceae bacterium]